MTYDDLRKALEGTLVLSDETIAKLHQYASLLKEWNEKMNLTAITEEGEVVEKHFYDCLIPAKVFAFDHLDVADMGSGAGFPGLLWAIVFPSAHFTLVEATGKKCQFLSTIVKTLSLHNVIVVNKRAEDLHEYEKYDMVTARALASVPVLLELCIPSVKAGGTFLAMKSSKGREELAESASAIQKMHVKLVKTQEDALPNNEGLRLNFFFQKIAITDRKYPRSWADIVKKTL
jgi:16S rRNA (guanine527-N7)-methyltransferase